MHELEHVDTLVVSQKREMMEVLTGFETVNKYVILDQDSRQLYYAAEIAGSTLGRWFLKASRPFHIRIVDDNGDLVFEVKRPFRFYFHTLEVFDADRNLLGTVTRHWSWVRRIYSVHDHEGNEFAQLFGPFFRPWTFEIRSNGKSLGKITKKWSGALKEMFTDADNFGVTFPREWNVEWKAVFLGAVFLIDFVHFENRG